MKTPKTTIIIDGKKISPIESVYLTQTINDHHHFEVVVNLDVIEKPGTHTINESRSWLGKPLVIIFGEREFLGVIVDLQMVHNDEYYGDLVISGYSKTILLEAGAHMQSWLDKDLASIVTNIVQEAGVEAQVKPVYTIPFEYQAQYEETHFKFLQRLAKQHNEWLFYDGEKLVFGKPALESPIELAYGTELSSIKVSIAAYPHSQELFSYNSLENKQDESKTINDVSGLNELGNYAFEVSKDLYKITPNAFSHTRVRDKGQIDTVVKNKQGSHSAYTNVLKCTSSKQGLTVGTVIKVAANFIDKQDVVKSHGEFIITKINHSATGVNSYSNEFEAISSSVIYLPEPHVEMAVAHNQIATVIANQDPKNKGRVEVRFQWQRGGMKTAWIRVMTPDAGIGDEHDENRGFVHIPEVGDTVMIGFRYNDPNRPFVMGSMFNGHTGIGGQVNNNIKTTITKSGHKIQFDDSPDRESITITDKSNNIIFIDTANSSIHMSAPENFTISAKNIDISATENLTLTAGDNMGISAGDDMNISAGDSLSVLANEDFSLLAKNITEQASENFESLAINIQEHAESVMKASAKEDMELNSSGTINNNSGSKIKLF